MGMVERFDEQAYQDGIAAFRAGASLRSLCERMAQEDAAGAEERGMCFGLGFADAALDALRAALNMVPPPDLKADR